MPLQSTNPDSRPMPPGWYQHYDPSRKTWYYVKTDINPPKHSFVHPADLNNTSSQRSSSRNPSQTALKPGSPADDAASSAPKLSAAQRLYASAQLERQSIHSSRSLIHAELPRASSIQHPTRAQSSGTIFATATNPSNYYNAHRSATLPAGIPSSQRASGVTEVRNIMTKAQPPSLLFSHPSGNSVSPPSQYAAARDAPLPPLPSDLNPSPTSSSIFSSQNSSGPTSPPQTSPSSPTPSSATSFSSISSNRVPDQASRRSSIFKAPIPETFVLSNHDPSSSSSSDARDTSALANALRGTALDANALQAVLLAEPNANYVAAITVLQQQQLLQPSLTSDYQILISQVQQLQARALQRQQNLLAQQISNLNNALLAQQQQQQQAGAAAVSLPTIPPAQQNPALAQRPMSMLHLTGGSQHSLPLQNLPSISEMGPNVVAPAQNSNRPPQASHQPRPPAAVPPPPSHPQAVFEIPPPYKTWTNSNRPAGISNHNVQSQNQQMPASQRPQSQYVQQQSQQQQSTFQQQQQQQMALQQQQQQQQQQHQLLQQQLAFQQQQQLALQQQQQQQQQATLTQAAIEQQLQANQAAINTFLAPPPADPQTQSQTTFMTTDMAAESYLATLSSSQTAAVEALNTMTYSDVLASLSASAQSMDLASLTSSLGNMDFGSALSALASGGE